MNIHTKNLNEGEAACDALVLPLPEGKAGYDESFPPSLKRLLKRVISRDFQGKLNEVMLVPAPDDIAPERILLAGLGKKNEITPERVRQAGGKSAAALKNAGMKRICVSSRVLSASGISPTVFIEGSLLGIYTFRKYLHETDDRKIDSITLLSAPSEELQKSLRWTKAVGSSVSFARDLINTPSNDMTPSHLARAARSLKSSSLVVKVLEKKDIMKLGMGSYLSVARGSHEPPKFIILEYKGAKASPLVLIGKSVTFDSGGISLKPSEGMEKMKYDMAGGAAVLGIVKAVSELKMPVHLIGILPATENLPGGAAAKPGDIVRAMNGKTIEIISTDAEGRMTLADAIAFAGRYKPKAIIDIATLTGACSIAFGNGAIAMMGNNRELIDALKKAGEETHERVWEMPLFDEYKEYVKGDVADLKNTGGRNGSLISSAYFLYEFAENTPWVHLDIAGTAWVDKEKPYTPKGASGVGVRLILHFIKELK